MPLRINFILYSSQRYQTLTAKVYLIEHENRRLQPTQNVILGATGFYYYSNTGPNLRLAHVSALGVTIGSCLSVFFQARLM